MEEAKRFDAYTIEINVAPLIRALADETAVIFVGAGASVAAGLPSWHEFLRSCLQRARQFDRAAVIWDHIDSLLEEGKYLPAAELLQWAVRNDLHHYIWDAFGNHSIPPIPPSDVHLAIARMPFRVAVTTNYDSLLEAACTAMSRPLIHACTWQQPDDIYQAFRDRGRFTLIKTHGTATQRDSLILTHTHYRDLQSKNPSYNDLIAHLLSFRTCLFVGHSLRDLDILDQLSKVRAIHGDSIGPHYAILFDGEKERYELEHLESTCNIRPILIHDDNTRPFLGGWNTTANAAHQPNEINTRRTAAVVKVLKELHGQVAVFRRNRGFSLSVEPAPFNRRDASQHLLRNVLHLTGAFRGDICMVDDPDRPELRVVVSHTGESVSRNAGENDARSTNQHIPPRTIIGRTFYRSTSGTDFTYVRDVTAITNGSDGTERQLHPDLDDSGIPDAEYEMGHPDVRSELAVPVLFAGTVVGVLNVESTLCDAFTNDHLNVVRWGAQEAGRIWNRANLRNDLTRALDPCYSQVEAFGELIERSRMVRDLDLRYILYEIDHFTGQANPKLANPEPGQRLEPFRFDERSLTTYVLTKEFRKFVPDVDEDIRDPNGICSERGARELRFHGPAFGVALQKDGRPTAVLTCYSQRMTNLWGKWNSEMGLKWGPGREWNARIKSLCREGDFQSQVRFTTEELEAMSREWDKLAVHFRDATTRIERLAQLISNDSTVHRNRNLMTSDAGKAIESLNGSLFKVDRGQQWTEEQLGNPHFQRQIFRAVCESLLQTCGFRRIRLWWVPKRLKGIALVCIWSLTRPDSTIGGKPRQNAYRGVAAQKGSPYYDLVHAMSATPPAARYHNVRMFNMPDENFEILDKKKEGSWMVVPILAKPRSELSKGPKVVGCISGDMQYPTHGGEIEDDWNKKPEKHAFQRYALELAADVLTPLVRLYRLDPNEIRNLVTVGGKHKIEELVRRESETS